MAADERKGKSPPMGTRARRNAERLENAVKAGVRHGHAAGIAEAALLRGALERLVEAVARLLDKQHGQDEVQAQLDRAYDEAKATLGEGPAAPLAEGMLAEVGSVHDHLSRALTYLRETDAARRVDRKSPVWTHRRELARELDLTDYQVDAVVRLMVEEELVTTADVRKDRRVALTASGRTA